MSGRGSITNPWDIVTAIASADVKSGHRLNLRAGTYTGNYIPSWEATTSSGGEITMRAYPGEHAIIDGNIIIGKEWLVIEGLHIKDSDFIDRATVIEDGTIPEEWTAASAFDISASNVLIRDCIIENCLQGGQIHSTTINVTYDGCIIYYNGWNAPDRPHGHGIYVNGIHGTVKNCILFSNAAYGAKIYGGGQDISYGTIEDNIAFNNCGIFGEDPDNGNLLIGNESIADDNLNPIMRRNYTYQLPANRTNRKNHFGHNNTFKDAIMTDNYMPEGCVVLQNPPWTGLTWIDYSGNILEPEAINKVVIIPVRGRLHVAIYNWELEDTVTVDVSAYWSQGQSVTVANVEDYFTDIDTLTVGAGGTLAIDMTAAGHSVQAGQGFDTPATCFPEFGCFVIRAT
jgi:hypothetical protein